MSSVKASDINLAIKNKYSDDQWKVWFEVSQSTGHNSGRRADAVVLNVWPSKAYQLHVFEVKVSRADFKNELSDLTKWKAVGRYADFFWLAVPVGLVSVDEVPNGWGLMELTKAGLRVKKQAPANTDPDPIDRGFAASLLRSGEDLTQNQIDKKVDDIVSSKLSQIEKDAERRFLMRLNSEKEKNKRLQIWIDDFKRNFDCDFNIYTPPAQMAEKIRLADSLLGRDLALLKSKVSSLNDLIQSINLTEEEVE